MDDKTGSKTEYVGIRTTKEVVGLMNKFAEKNDISVSKLINIAVLDYLGEERLLGLELQRKIIK